MRNCSVAAIAVGVSLSVYILLGSSGYSTFGTKVEHDILANYPASNQMVAIARLAISFVVTCCYPLQAHPSRTCVTTIVNTTPLGKAIDPTVLHVIITTVP